MQAQTEETMNQLGNIALNISVATYLLYFVPQLIHNHKHHSQNLSWGLHILYIGGMCCDLIYGFGNHLTIQYRFVTIVGLICLAAQHLQLLRSKTCKKSMSLLASLLYAAAIMPLVLNIHLNTKTYNYIGLLSQLCWWSAFIPQIIKNYQTKNGDALASMFIALTITCSILDLIAAVCLHWPYPSIISPPIMIALHSTCWLQKKYYQRKQLYTLDSSLQPS
jgi:uncharacterized protein with PQ loop repeat